ncbi:MAG: hypothetical protein IAE99_12880 [Rhodothermales bacterium]|nr:hypothetical protein [Rhodothermales bacterium]MCA0267965.1 hypothetical protein [Bacteroidota bacterium]
MAFDSDTFTRRLLGEALFYDEEYGVGGTLSLVDPQERKEKYLAAFIPEDDQFVIEEATEWEDYDEADDEIGYALAVDSREHGSYDEVEQITDALLTLAREQGLEPSLTLRYEEDEDE